jgi:hypothetical protein
MGRMFFSKNIFWVLALLMTWRDNFQGKNSRQLSGASKSWLHLRVRYLSRRGPGATVSTLQTEYLYIQASSQDKERGVYSHAATL